MMEKTGEITDRTPAEQEEEQLSKKANERLDQRQEHLTQRTADHAQSEIGKNRQR